MLLKFGEEGLREGSRSNGHDGVDHGDWVDYIEVPVVVLNQIAATLAARQPGTQEPDPTLLRFYQVTDYPSLVWALEAHVLKLIDTCARNVKPWEDTFPPTLLPKSQREQAAQGIDLGQQQDAARWRWVREQNGVTVSVEEADDDGDMAFVSGHTPEELDAAIDGQRDAAPGVGS